MKSKYNPQKIEKKWQKKWAEDSYELWHSNEDKKEKKYVLDMFPYPSGSGLHVGHLVGYIGSDIVSRFYRMKGFKVLHPMGWDAFGLPAENFAIKNKINPRDWTEKNIADMRADIQSLG